MKTTKNKYLLKMLKDYEVIQRNPKLFSVLDLHINSTPFSLPLGMNLFVPKHYHKTIKYINKYKGYKIVPI